MADANRIQVRLVTPDRTVVDTQADAVELPAANGYIEVLPGHAPLLSKLGAGLVTIHGGEAGEQKYFVAWGFVEVLPDRVTLLAESAQKPEDISQQDARAELQRGNKQWQQAGDSADAYADANETIHEAEARLQAASR